MHNTVMYVVVISPRARAERYTLSLYQTAIVIPHCFLPPVQLKNADYFSQYVTEDFEQYINRKRSDQCYGNNLEMQAIAEMYNRAIEVFQYSTGEPLSNIGLVHVLANYLCAG